MNYSTGRPLASFVVFAYNQEAWVEQAVKGALAQSYRPIELIISDDCSSDRTFEVIKETVATSTCDVQPIVRRNRENLGLGRHISTVAEMCKGEFIIMAAGDDISQPQRTSEHVRAYLQSQMIYAVFSGFEALPGESARNLRSRRSYEERMLSTSSLAKNGGGAGLGATFSYRKKVFNWPWIYPAFLVNEDRILPFRASILGKVIYLSNPLVYYRISPNSIRKRKTCVSPVARNNRRHLLELCGTLRFASRNGYLNEAEVLKARRALVRRFNCIRRSRRTNPVRLLDRVQQKMLNFWCDDYDRLFRYYQKACGFLKGKA